MTPKDRLEKAAKDFGDAGNELYKALKNGPRGELGKQVTERAIEKVKEVVKEIEEIIR